MAKRFPDRVYDVGIAEQHAVASAAGLAYGGLHPVIAVYATFLNRAFDQLLMDVALHRAGVTLVLDRAGVTGPDGPSHHGMWDLSLLQIVPGLRIAAPRDSTRLREELREAVAVEDAPTVVRFSKGSVNDEIHALERLDDGVDVLHSTAAASNSDYANDVLIVSVGTMGSCPSTWPRGWRTKGSLPPSSTRAGCFRSRRRSCPLPHATGSWCASRTASEQEAWAPESGRRCELPEWTPR